MSMPYHKELLRSSVSLCFREFFVFRNKAKGVMTLLCQFEKMIYPSGTGAADAASFMIALYRPCEKLKDSSGNTITQIKAVGYCLPTAGNMRYEMRGHWRKDPKYGIQYDVEGYEEQIIPTREGIIAYLSSGQIKGIGPKMAERIYDAFGNMALEVLDKKPEKLLTISGISQNKLKKICDSYLANRGARDVVALVEIKTAFDMDFATNHHVQNGYNNLLQLLGDMGFRYGTYLWDPTYKGLDDYIWEYLFRKKQS